MKVEIYLNEDKTDKSYLHITYYVIGFLYVEKDRIRIQDSLGSLDVYMLDEINTIIVKN